jgi:hypothetical protein
MNRKILFSPIAMFILLMQIACAGIAASPPWKAPAAAVLPMSTPSMALAWTVPIGKLSPTRIDTPYCTPTDILPSVTPTFLQTVGEETPAGTESTPAFHEYVYDEFGFDFGTIRGWVKVIFSEDPDYPGFGTGSAMIFSDSTEGDLLWKSPDFEGINAGYLKMNGVSGYGQNVLLVGWGIGAHSIIFYPIIYLADRFQIPPIVGEEGRSEEGFVSDTGFVYPYPDGSIAVGVRNYEGPIQSQIDIYRFDGKRYYLARILQTDEDVEDWIQSMTATAKKP